MIRRNSSAGVVQRAALAFFVRAGRAGIPHATAAPLCQIPTLTALPLPNFTWTVPQKTSMPNVCAAVVFWRAPGYQRGPSPRQGFSIGGCPPTLRALDGDKSPLVWRADAPKNVWPAAAQVEPT